MNCQDCGRQLTVAEALKCRVCRGTDEDTGGEGLNWAESDLCSDCAYMMTVATQATGEAPGS